MVLVIILTREEAKIMLRVLEEWYKDHISDIADFKERRVEEELYDKLTKLLKKYLEDF